MVRTTPVARGDVPRLGAQPRRHPAAVRVRLEVRAHRRRHRRRPVRGRRRQPGRQPAHAVLDDPDLDGRVLEPARGRRRGATPDHGEPRRGPAPHGRSRPPCSSRAASRSPQPPARSTRSASARRATSSTGTPTSTEVLEPMRPVGRVALLAALWLLAWGEISRGQRRQRRRGRGGAARRASRRRPHDRAGRVSTRSASARLDGYVARPARDVERAS